ncbi:MAG: nucleoside deaminase [Bacilli bacterium]|nr:nucleoside deaminase [Bacilli bacterium]
MNDEYYMKQAINNAKKAYKLDEVPIGAIIVKDNKIISSTYNRKELDNIATYHAEILAINEACKKLKTWHLEDCTLYTTVEPCLMCTGAIKQARISKVVYGTNNPTFGYLSHLQDNKLIITKNILNDECLELLSDFFKQKR